MRTAGRLLRERRWSDMILEVLVTSTVLIIGIFCLRKLTLGKISMRLRYGLWLLVAVRLLVPLSVGTSALSVMNLLPETLRGNAQTISLERENGGELSVNDGQDSTHVGERGDIFFGEQNEGEELAAGQVRTGNGIMSAAADHAVQGEVVSDKHFRRWWAFSRHRLVITIWLVGFLAAGGYMLFCRQRFVRYLYRNRRELSVESVPDAFADRLSQRGMKVYQVKGLPGPCLAGRHIYIGEGTAAQAQHLTHVLAHEYCHALHRDGFWAFLRCLLAAVYWFDPFVWTAAYAARQDSELACDEAAVELLGESSRFAYGRTLLALLESAGGVEKCPGTSFMTEGGERSVRERILALAEKGRTKRTVLTAVLAAVVLVCGCAFTGADQKAGERQTDGIAAAGNGADAQGTEKISAAQDRQMVTEEENDEFARIQKEYEEAVKMAELLEEKTKETELLEEQIQELEESTQQEAEQAAFMEVLNYHGVMEGQDDSELFLNREVDYQSYYEFTIGETENPMENGWYRICENEDAGITLYGLYTEDFGFRGLKTLIGEDVNTYDIQWYPALVNSNKDNILVLERADDGLPRRFVWKLPAVDSSTEEIWRLYSGYRYDTGTVDVKMLSEGEGLAWANAHLSFDVDQEAAKVYVIYDEDMYLGEIDISAYAEWMTEYVQIVPDVFGVALDDRAGEGTNAAEGEGLAVYLSAGLKFEGVEGLWSDGLPLLTVQVVEDADSDSGFRLGNPRIDKTYVANAPYQEKKLSEIKNGEGKTGRE